MIITKIRKPRTHKRPCSNESAPYPPVEHALALMSVTAFGNRREDTSPGSTSVGVHERETWRYRRHRSETVMALPSASRRAWTSALARLPGTPSPKPSTTVLKSFRLPLQSSVRLLWLACFARMRVQRMATRRGSYNMANAPPGLVCEGELCSKSGPIARETSKESLVRSRNRMGGLEHKPAPTAASAQRAEMYVRCPKMLNLYTAGQRCCERRASGLRNPSPCTQTDPERSPAAVEVPIYCHLTSFAKELRTAGSTELPGRCCMQRTMTLPTWMCGCRAKECTERERAARCPRDKPPGRVDKRPSPTSLPARHLRVSPVPMGPRVLLPTSKLDASHDRDRGGILLDAWPSGGPNAHLWRRSRSPRAKTREWQGGCARAHSRKCPPTKCAQPLDDEEAYVDIRLRASARGSPHVAPTSRNCCIFPTRLPYGSYPKL